MVNWKDVSLCVANGGGEYDLAYYGQGERWEDIQRVALLREYRDTGAMHGAWPCTVDELNAADEANDELADVGTNTDEIDWTGLDAVGL